MMAEKKQPLKKARKQKSAVRKSGAISRKRPVTKVEEAPVANPGEAEAKQSAEAGFEVATDADGEKILFDSLNSTLAAKSDGIVKKLGEQAAAGNNASARLLVEILALRSRNGKRVTKRPQELISTIENDSEWTNSEANSPGLIAESSN